MPLAVVRLQVPPAELPRAVPECCGRVWSTLRAQGLRGGRHVALYWDDAIRLEAGVELLAPFAEQDGVVRSATPSGRTAVVEHFGPYSSLGAAHQAIRAWATEIGHRLAGPRWEIYGHWQDAWNSDPSQIRTDVCYLLGPV